MSVEQQREANRTAVVYALGDVYGLNKVALQRLMRSQAQAKVASVGCGLYGRALCRRAVRGNEWLRHEDANMGLALHLLGVRLASLPCFLEGGQELFRALQKKDRRLSVRHGCKGTPLHG